MQDAKLDISLVHAVSAAPHGSTSYRNLSLGLEQIDPHY